MPRHRQLARHSVTVGLLAALAVGTTAVAALVMRAPGAVVGPCAISHGPVTLPDVPETSGLAVGRRTSGVLWSHNDSGNASVLFGIDATGGVQGRVQVPAGMRDWEDVSAARCPAGDCLYLADIGDNGRQRARVAILRVPEPLVTDAATGAPEVFTVSYPDGPQNAEAMFMADGAAFIVTKDRVGRVYRASPMRPGGGALTLQHVATLGLATVTDAETSVDQRTVVVRTPGEVALYWTAALVAGRAVPYVRIDVTGLRELQGEGVALDGSTLHLSSEGKPWRPAGSLVGLRCRLPEPGTV